MMSSSLEGRDLEDKKKLMGIFLEDMETSTPKSTKQIEMQPRGKTDQSEASAAAPPTNPIAASERRGASISLKHTEGQRSPKTMRRGTAVACGNIVFFNSCGSRKILAHDISHSDVNHKWFRAPDYPYKYTSLVVIGGLVTGVGGIRDGFFTSCTSSLYSLVNERGGEGGRGRDGRRGKEGEGEGGRDGGRGRGREGRWIEIFPPMPTARGFAGAVSNERVLVVMGGGNLLVKLSTVEVMNISSRQWSAVCPLPRPLTSITAGICGDRLYLGGFFYCSQLSFHDSYIQSPSVITCSMSELLAHVRGGVANKVGVASDPRGGVADSVDVSSNPPGDVASEGLGGTANNMGVASDPPGGVADKVGVASDPPGDVADKVGVASDPPKSVTNGVGGPSNSVGGRGGVAGGGVSSVSVWSSVADLPVTCSSLVVMEGSVVAAGGKLFHSYSDAVYRYDPNADSWTVIGRLKSKRSLCLAAVTPGNRLLVVGGLIPHLQLVGEKRSDVVDVLSMR